MEAVGLDCSVAQRGLAVIPSTTADRLVGTPGIRVLKPIGARLRAEDPGAKNVSNRRIKKGPTD
jgi:hypothetical protein